MNSLFVMAIDNKTLGSLVGTLCRNWRPFTVEDMRVKEGIVNILAEISLLTDGTRKTKLEISSRWKCPKCGTEICGIGFGDLAESGTPICGECGEDMEFAGEDICLAETSEVLYRS